MNLFSLSRSDIAWKDAKYAEIWEYLRDEFELTQRFASLDFKLKFVEVCFFKSELVRETVVNCLIVTVTVIIFFCCSIIFVFFKKVFKTGNQILWSGSLSYWLGLKYSYLYMILRRSLYCRDFVSILTPALSKFR